MIGVAAARPSRTLSDSRARALGLGPRRSSRCATTCWASLERRRPWRTGSLERCWPPIRGCASCPTAAGRWWPRCRARRSGRLPLRRRGRGDDGHARRRRRPRDRSRGRGGGQGTRCEIVLDESWSIPAVRSPAVEITRVTGITDAMVRAAPSVRGAGRARCCGALAGTGVRGPQCAIRLGLSGRRAASGRVDLALDGPRLCTVRLARRLVPGLPSCGLDTLTRWFGIENQARHRAGGDAGDRRLLSRSRLCREDGGRTLADLRAGGGARTRREARAAALPPSHAPIPGPGTTRDAGPPSRSAPPLPHARGGPPATRRRRHVRRRAEAAVGEAHRPRTSGTGSRSRCAASWSSTPTGWC